MPDKPHRLKVSLPRLLGLDSGNALRPELLQVLADQINEKAEDRRMIGQWEPSGDGRIRIGDASHVVLPTAKVTKSGALLVDIKLLDTPMGRNLQALLWAGLKLKGTLRGVGSTIDDVTISGVDVDVTASAETTVLDDIVDALEMDD